MKRILLTLGTVCFSAMSVFSQAFTDGENGYTIDYSGTTADATCLLTCCGDTHNGGYAFTGGGIASAGGAVDGTDKFLKITAGSTIDITGSPGYFDLYFTNGADCHPMEGVGVVMDMSGTGDGKISVLASSNTEGAVLRIYLASGVDFPDAGESTYIPDAGDNTKNVIWEITLTTTPTTYSFNLESDADWAAWADNNAINMFGVTVGTANAEYYIHNIKFGADATLTSVNSVQELPSSVTIYPNPSSDVLKVDLSSLNLTNADLKLMNANGTVVKEEVNVSSIAVDDLNSGLYFLQINEYKPVKVVVQ